jgi:stearoyl-CoA desaturase (delta-9 desaturase)
MHVEHPKYSDTENDPHSPSIRGAKVLLLDYNIDSKKLNGPSKLLLKDRFHLFLHNYYALVHVAWAALLLTFGIHFLFAVYVIPMLLTVFMSNYVIYFCHNKKYGYANFDAGDSSRNNLFGGYLVFGEGWHNNHHKYPRKANFKEKWWEFDLSYQIVKLIQVHDVLPPDNKQSS